eukprot:TRINITY_DN5896_c0_g1_i3.p1 TRINITY_DN5896_c0_g1~~TRINITY_DN5896_c0_g1_i3.p1  ORF type:complete len:1103 (-),score=224.35 TRINITY_DN5896_c0_g1_i3:88-3396(-)
MIRRPPRSTLSSSSAASDVYKRQVEYRCNVAHSPPICEEYCWDTKEGTARADVKRKSKYWCDYKGETPIRPKDGVTLMAPLPGPGEKCDSAIMAELGAKKGSTPHGCAPGARCRTKTMKCEEICLPTKTKTADQVKLVKHWCDYGKEDPTFDDVTKDGSIGNPCDNSTCVVGAWCHTRNNMCYEQCYATPTRDAIEIPFQKSNKFLCDYGKEKHFSRSVEIDPKKQYKSFRKSRAGKKCAKNKNCGSHEFCHPDKSICYERCYLNAKSSTLKSEIAERGVKCDYGGKKPMILPPFIAVKKTQKINLHRLCPSGAMAGRLPCNQGDVLCEDVYSECGELQDKVSVRQKCLSMGCPLKTLDDSWQKVVRVDYHPDPKQWRKVFVTGTQTTNWVSSDGGTDFTAVKTSFTLRGFKWHPFQPWAIAYEANVGCIVQHKYRCYGTLVLSKDSGLSWTRILENVKYPNYAWVAATEKGSAWNERADILAIQHKSDRGLKWSWDTNLNLVYSDTFFGNDQMSVLMPKGNNFAIVDNYIYVAVATTSTQVNLWVSTNNAATFSQVKMPFDAKERSYGILHTAEQACFVIVRGGKIKSKSGSLYLTDESGTSMALSLNDMHYERGRVADIVKVQGLDGVYLVNTVVADAQDNVAPLFSDDESDLVDGGDSLRLRTKITFDKGSTWHTVNPPKKDAKGMTYSCGSKCNLHLFFKANPKQYSPILSVSSGTGLVMATGVVAPDFTEDVDADEVGTFFSRDAGHSWTELFKGPSVFSMSNHGGLMVVARKRGAFSKSRSGTKFSFMYSWNEGDDWKTYTLPTQSDGVTPLMISEITQIVTDSDAASQVFVVVGHTTEKKFVAVHVDFSTLHTRACKGEDKADSANSDYEVWSPRNFKGTDRCVLGRSVTYTRRKQNAECFNSLDRDRKTLHANCKCTHADFECDQGFQRAKHGHDCNVLPSKDVTSDKKAQNKKFVADMLRLSENPESLPEVCGIYPDEPSLTTITGYRRIPGDTCVGGLKLVPQTFECDHGLSLSLGSSTSGSAMFYLFGFCVAVGGLFYFRETVLGFFSGSGQEYTVLDDSTALEAPESLFEDSDQMLDPSGDGDDDWASRR